MTADTEFQDLLSDVEDQLIQLSQGFLYYLAHYLGHYDAGVSVLDMTAKKRGLLDTEDTAVSLFGPGQHELHDIAQALTRSLHKVQEDAEETGVTEFHPLAIEESPNEISEELVRSGDLQGDQLLGRRDTEANAIRFWMNSKQYAEHMLVLVDAIAAVRRDASYAGQQLDEAAEKLLEALGDVIQEFGVMRELVTHVLQASRFPHELRNQKREIELGALKGKVDLGGVRKAGRRPETQGRRISAPLASSAPAAVSHLDQKVIQDLLKELDIEKIPSIEDALSEERSLDHLWNVFGSFYHQLHAELNVPRDESLFLAMMAACQRDAATVPPDSKEKMVEAMLRITDQQDPTQVALLFREFLEVMQPGRGWPGEDEMNELEEKRS